MASVPKTGRRVDDRAPRFKKDDEEGKIIGGAFGFLLLLQQRCRCQRYLTLNRSKSSIAARS